MSGWSRPDRLTGIALPMAIWALHFVVVYSVQGAVCARGGASAASTDGLTSTSWWLLGLTMLALLVIAALGVRAWRAWRMAAAAAAAAPAPAPAPAPQAGTPSPVSRRRFASAATALSAALATVAVVFTAVPILLLPPCA